MLGWNCACVCVKINTTVRSKFQVPCPEPLFSSLCIVNTRYRPSRLFYLSLSVSLSLHIFQPNSSVLSLSLYHALLSISYPLYLTYFSTLLLHISTRILSFSLFHFICMYVFCPFKPLCPLDRHAANRFQGSLNVHKYVL
jgi:hypothetical protein